MITICLHNYLFLARYCTVNYESSLPEQNNMVKIPSQTKGGSNASDPAFRVSVTSEILSMSKNHWAWSDLESKRGCTHK